ncbi:MAG: ATP-binding protein [Thermodesulfovibrionales bacterium]|nr:ATP-binding protein [Thermodesulfovibrionales bacterium]MDP3110492.1 ATP-binding protein [Thermodesulfovibrionales bacterium]
MTYLPREITNSITSALDDMPVVVITGMRQTGKSTFLQQQAELQGRKYVTLDDFAQLAAARENPDGFVETDGPLTIDEAQRCPELFVAIKRAVDRNRVPGKFILSGSANFLLMKNISESLAGRAAYFTMHPFIRRELKAQLTKKPFIRKFFEKQTVTGLPEVPPVSMAEIIKGGMPSVCLGSLKNTINWFKGYEHTYLDRDIRDLGRIGNIIPFRGLLHLAALRTSGILSISELGRDARLTSSMVSSYLSIMEVSCIFYRLAPYLKNPASRLIKSPKFYIGDSGLACYLAGKDDLSDDPLKGAMVETYAAQNIVGIIDSTWPQADLYFWNIQGRHEVDFIVEAGNKCIAIEVKSAARWERDDLSGLKSFVAATPHCAAGILAYNGSTPVKLGSKLWAIPLSLLLQ